jgi:hypothetical protein
VAPPIQADLARAAEAKAAAKQAAAAATAQEASRRAAAKQAAEQTAAAQAAHRARLATIATTASVARGAASGRVGSAAAASTGALAAAVTGPVGITIAAFAAAVGGAAVAVRSFGKLVEGQVSRLAGFSGEVAAAQAETDLRREVAQFRRAEQIGPQLAAAERFRGRLEQKSAELQTRLLAIVLELAQRAEPALEGLFVVLDKVVTLTEIIMKVVNEHLGKLAILAPGLAAIVKLLSEIGENTRPEEEPGFEDPFLDEFMGHVQNTPLFWPQGQPLPEGRGAVPLGV